MLYWKLSKDTSVGLVYCDNKPRTKVYAIEERQRVQGDESTAHHKVTRYPDGLQFTFTSHHGEDRGVKLIRLIKNLLTGGLLS